MTGAVDLVHVINAYDDAIAVRDVSASIADASPALLDGYCYRCSGSSVINGAG